MNRERNMQEYLISFWKNDELLTLSLHLNNFPTFDDGERLYINNEEFIDFSPYSINMVELEDNSPCDDCDVADPLCNKCIGA
jgi:hypothetical protein